MSSGDAPDLPINLASGHQMLIRAHENYGRPLSPKEYWWLGVGLAAVTLAELNERPYAVGRIAQLMERLPDHAAGDDWLQRLVDELAEMDAEGLLWPVYQRDEAGPLAPTGLVVCPDFDAEAGYFLALAHIGVALAVNRDDSESVTALATAIAEMVETGLTSGHEELVLGVLRAESENT